MIDRDRSRRPRIDADRRAFVRPVLSLPAATATLGAVGDGQAALPRMPPIAGAPRTLAKATRPHVHRLVRHSPHAKEGARRSTGRQ